MADNILEPAYSATYESCTPGNQPADYLGLSRHWVLRLLLDLGGHKEVLLESHCNDREMVCFIGLGPADIEVDGLYWGPLVFSAISDGTRSQQRRGVEFVSC